MFTLSIPGFSELNLTHAIFDYNGTLALDGNLIEGVRPLLIQLAEQLHIHVVTGDTNGTVRQALVGINCTISIMPATEQGLGKLKYLQQLDAKSVIVFGNGRNDQQILKEAQVGVIVLGPEGAAIESLLAADLVMPDIISAMKLLTTPRRLLSGLRS